MSRRYWALLLDQPGTNRWAVIAESVNRPFEAVVIRDGFPSQQAAIDYINEVTQRQTDVANIRQ